MAGVTLQLEPAKKAPLSRSTAFAVDDDDDKVVVTVVVDKELPDSLINGGLMGEKTGALLALLEEDKLSCEQETELFNLFGTRGGLDVSEPAKTGLLASLAFIVATRLTDSCCGNASR